MPFGELVAGGAVDVEHFAGGGVRDGQRDDLLADRAVPSSRGGSASSAANFRIVAPTSGRPFGGLVVVEGVGPLASEVPPGGEHDGAGEEQDRGGERPDGGHDAHRSGSSQPMR